MFNWLRHILRGSFDNQTVPNHRNDIKTKKQNLSNEPAVHYKKLSVLDKTPSNSFINEKDFIIVVDRGKFYWALFRCPCGCGNVISLSLQKNHNPSWTVRKTPAGRPTVHPSIWQNKGCCSHFWIKDGRVYWCNNTGIEPWVAEPLYYSKTEMKA
ncbi:MAG: hypothetical protein K4571_20090 [Deltaproteobacteria bacterium]